MDADIIVLHIIEPKEKKILVTHEKPIISISLNSSKSLLMTTAEDFKFKTLDLETETLVSDLKSLSIVKSVHFGNSNFLAYGLKDGTVTIETLVERKVVYKEKLNNPIISLAFSMKDKMLGVTHTQSNDVIIFSIEVKQSKDVITIPEYVVNKNSLKDHTSEVNCLAFTMDGKYLLSGSNDKTIIVWNIKKFKVYKRFKDHKCEVTAIAVNNKNLAASGSMDKKIIIWNLKYMRQEFYINAHSEKITCVNFSNCGNYLISGSFDKMIMIWNLLERRLEFSVEGHTNNINSVLFINDSNDFISASDDKTLKLWRFNPIPDSKNNFHLLYNNEKVESLTYSFCRKYSIVKTGPNKMFIGNNSKNIISKYPSTDWTYMFTEHSNILLQKKNSEDTFIIHPKTGDKSKESEVKIFNGNLNNLESFYECGYQNVIHHKGLINCLKRKTFKNIDIKCLDCYVGEKKFTGLHIAAHEGYHKVIKKLHKNPIIPLRSDDYGFSPLRYSILRKNQQCTDQLLKYMIILSESPKSFIFIASIYAIRKDLPLLIKDLSCQLEIFFKCLLNQKFKDIHFGDPDEEFMTKISDTCTLVFKNFKDQNRRKSDKALQNDTKENLDSSKYKKDKDLPKKPLLLKTSLIPFKSNFYTVTSLKILESLMESKNDEIFRTEFIQYIIKHNWKDMKIYIQIYSLLQVFNAFLLYLAIYAYSNQNMYLNTISIILINILIFVECIQLHESKENYYWEDGWNIVDIFRAFITLSYLLFYYNNDNVPSIITWIIIVTNFIRAMSGFRTIESTRYYVRLIASCFKETWSFLVIFMCSVMCFGLLNISVENSDFTFNELTILPFALTAGVIDVDHETEYVKGLSIALAITINVIMLLNILISILGDCFDEFQYKFDIYNYKEMVSVVYECKCLSSFFFSKKENEGFLQVCIDMYNDPAFNWKGKVLNIRDYIREFNKSLTKKLKKNEKTFNKSIENIQKQIDSMQKSSEIAQKRSEEIINKRFDEILNILRPQDV